MANSTPLVESVSHARQSPLWWAEVDLAQPGRPSLTSDLAVDVAIVGGGFSGLWSAYSLKGSTPVWILRFSKPALWALALAAEMAAGARRCFLQVGRNWRVARVT